MITYRAMYKFVENGVHGEVLDFPGVITFGSSLEETRRLLAGALVDMAETCIFEGESLPSPDPTCSDSESDLEEPIHLPLTAANQVEIIPKEVTPFRAQGIGLGV